MPDLYGRRRSVHCEVGDRCRGRCAGAGARCARCEGVVAVLQVCIAGVGAAG